MNEVKRIFTTPDSLLNIQNKCTFIAQVVRHILTKFNTVAIAVSNIFLSNNYSGKLLNYRACDNDPSTFYREQGFLALLP